jgi:hypothetical protein
MATVTCTTTVPGTFGSNIRALAKALEKLAQDIPDNNPAGASSVLTIDNGTGFAKVTISAGPYTNTTGYTAGG